MIVDTSDDESPIDPTAAAPHETFYFEDGNVELMCRNTLFRVHTTILSFHSPEFRRMFTQTRLATAESPNGCPRLVSSDTSKDFATLLKMIYLPGFVAPPARWWTVPLTVCLSTDSLRGIKCQISPHSHPSSESRQSTRYRLSNLSYSASFVRRTQTLLRGCLLPSRLERESSAVRLLTRMQSSTSLSGRRSRPHCRWHTIWRFEGVRIP